MNMHIKELNALHRLKQKNEVLQFAQGVGSAVTKPVTGVVKALIDPIAAGKNIYNTVGDTVASVHDGVESAVQSVTGQEDKAPKVADREHDELVNRMLGQPAARRELANQYGVDPYTHYKPLKRKLDLLASYQTAGQFGASRALSFVPGAGAIVVTGFIAASKLTDDALNKTPKRMAEINRRRLTESGFSTHSINAFALNPNYTPTEKTLFTGRLVESGDILHSQPILDYAASASSRTQVAERIQALDMAIAEIRRSPDAERVDIVQDHPVVHLRDGRVIVIGIYDLLSWTRRNAANLRAMATALSARNKSSSAIRFQISGRVTKRAASAISKLGWTLKTASRTAI